MEDGSLLRPRATSSAMEGRQGSRRKTKLPEVLDQPEGISVGLTKISDMCLEN